MRDYLENRWEASSEEIGKASNAQFEQVSAYLLTTFKREGSILDAPFSKRHAPEEIKALNASLDSLARRINLPIEIIVRHPGVNGAGLQRLLDHFMEHDGKLEALLLAPPESDDSYGRLVSVMNRINSYIYPAFNPPTLIPLHALVTTEWLRGLSLSAIIASRIKYHRKHGHKIDLPKLFRQTMALVEQTARFLAPKYISAYVDVLNFHLKNIGRSDLVSGDLEYGVMLEFGLSTKTLMSLTQIGLSRMSAVELYEKIARDDLDLAGVRAWLMEYGPRLESLEVPALIIREIRSRVTGIDPYDQDIDDLI